MCWLSLGVSAISKNYVILGIIYVSVSMWDSKPSLGVKKKKKSKEAGSQIPALHVHYSIICNSQEVDKI